MFGLFTLLCSSVKMRAQPRKRDSTIGRTDVTLKPSTRLKRAPNTFFAIPFCRFAHLGGVGTHYRRRDHRTAVAAHERPEPVFASGVRGEQLVERQSGLAFRDRPSRHAKIFRYWAGTSSQTIRCFVSSGSMGRIERAAGLENPVNERQKFPHDGDNDGHFRCTALTQTGRELREWRVKANRYYRGKVDRLPKMSVPGLYQSARPSHRARLVVSG